MRHYYVGLMSGTSRDGIDAAMLAVDGDTLSYIGGQTTPYPNALRQQLAQLVQPSGDELDQAGRVDQLLGAHFAEATEQLLLSHKIPAERITAIGSHGHTLRHRPHPPYPFTWQMADPNQIAWRTGITTIADFRRMDMAAGGQGAPLVPAFHRAWFANRAENRVILNIGGIANITLLPASAPQQVTGFDTGPGNTLMDAWIRECEGKSHDQDGAWAAGAAVDEELLGRLLQDPYFQREPPKSTGPEYFNLTRIRPFIESKQPRRVQATLCELTARSIADAIARYAPDTDRVILCGGGSHNGHLLERLRHNLAKPCLLESTQAHGLDPDFVEAAAFAWLAHRRLENAPGNVPAVTGACQEVILGGVYSPVSYRKG